MESGEKWRQILGRLRVVTLSAPLVALMPPLALPTLSKSTRGVSFYPGKVGAALGISLLAGSIFIGTILNGTFGLVVALLPVWLLGTTGAAMFVNGFRPMAFVKPICVRCRLLPVIEEHESIHLSGVTSEKAVWDSMKERHSVESLALAGDPAICTFCPIPKRLRGVE